MNTTYLDWEKEIDELNIHETGGCSVAVGNICDCADGKEIKDFIRVLIDKVALQTKEEMKGVIEGMAFKDPNQAGQFAMHADGYNEAIEEVIEALASTNPSE